MRARRAAPRRHFNKSGWPQSARVDGYPGVAAGATPSEQQQAALIDTLQDWKTDHYKARTAARTTTRMRAPTPRRALTPRQDLIGSGAVETRPGVLALMDEAKRAGLKVAVCSAATKDAALFTVSSLLGEARFKALDLFLAGNDVAKLKPDPTIYLVAAERLGRGPAARTGRACARARARAVLHHQ